MGSLADDDKSVDSHIGSPGWDDDGGGKREDDVIDVDESDNEKPKMKKEGTRVSVKTETKSSGRKRKAETDAAPSGPTRTQPKKPRGPMDLMVEQMERERDMRASNHAETQARKVRQKKMEVTGGLKIEELRLKAAREERQHKERMMEMQLEVYRMQAATRQGSGPGMYTSPVGLGLNTSPAFHDGFGAFASPALAADATSFVGSLDTGNGFTEAGPSFSGTL